jgi:pSer/pThr/pTyr-binding forkhead associated (FHA) protein
MFRADGERRSFSISHETTVIGRREDCELRIPLTEVSRKHCRLIIDGESVRIEDLGSSNGTFVNGQRVREATLSPGATISVGPVVFVIQINGEPADDQLQPVMTPSRSGRDERPGGAEELEVTTEGIPDIVLEDSAAGQSDALVDLDIESSRH